MRRELAPGRGRRSHDDDGRLQIAPSGLTTHPDLLTRRPATAVALQESAGNAAVASRLRAVQRDFASQGYGVKEGGTAHTITRPKQVLHEYGITCYGTSVMYMLQSYGLVPPTMTRVEFEHAFTPLNPLHRGGAKTGPITVGGVEQKKAVPIDLMTKSLQGTERPSKRDSSIGKITTTEATLRCAARQHARLRHHGADAGHPRHLDVTGRQAGLRVPQGPPRARRRVHRGREGRALDRRHRRPQRGKADGRLLQGRQHRDDRGPPRLPAGREPRPLGGDREGEHTDLPRAVAERRQLPHGHRLDAGERDPGLGSHPRRIVGVRLPERTRSRQRPTSPPRLLPCWPRRRAQPPTVVGAGWNRTRRCSVRQRAR